MALSGARTTSSSSGCEVFLGLGSNQGDRRLQVLWALRRLGEAGLRVSALSSLYETEPVGMAGPDFLNLACRLTTNLKPLSLLHTCLEIEASLGRTRGLKRGPRTIDIDLLYYGNLIRFSRNLTLPHPFIGARRFVLEPMLEIAPSFIDPISGLTISEQFERCEDHSGIKRIGELEEAVPLFHNSDPGP